MVLRVLEVGIHLNSHSKSISIPNLYYTSVRVCLCVSVASIDWPNEKKASIAHWTFDHSVCPVHCIKRLSYISNLFVSLFSLAMPNSSFHSFSVPVFHSLPLSHSFCSHFFASSILCNIFTIFRKWKSFLIWQWIAKRKKKKIIKEIKPNRNSVIGMSDNNWLVIKTEKKLKPKICHLLWIEKKISLLCPFWSCGRPNVTLRYGYGYSSIVIECVRQFLFICLLWRWEKNT